MKKYLPHIFITTFLIGLTGVFGVGVAQAAIIPVPNPFEMATEGIANLVLQAMAFLIYLSGYLLDYSLSWTLNIASFVKDIGAIETGWKVFRDLCTMFFIFILLYNAISVILGKSSTDEAKKVVASIVIAGLLINFSLFFTKIIIDASNVISLGFYKALVPNPDTNLSASKAVGISATGLSAIFMNSLYIQTTYDSKGLQTIQNDQLSGSALTAGATGFLRRMISMVMGSIVMLIASIVFLAAAFFFMVRIVMLLLLMVTSPIAFAGEALGGKAASQATRWWETLINQCLFMPVYLAMTYVGIKIIASPEFQNAVNPGSGSMSAVAGGGAVGVIFNYCVVIIFLMASLIIAKEFGVMGADTFSGWAKNVGLALPRLMGTGGSALARTSLGRAGADLDKRAGNTWIGNTGLGRSLRENTVGALAKAKFGGERSFKDEKDRDKENDAKKQQIADNATIRTGANASAAIASRGAGATATPKEQAEINAGAIALQKMSAAEIVTQTPEMLAQNAGKLNESHLKAIIKSDKITEADKDKVFAARFKDLDDARKAVPPDAAKLEEAIERLSDTDIENLGYERLNDPVLIDALPYSKIKIATDKKTEGYSPDQKKEFKKAKFKNFTDVLNGVSGPPYPDNIREELAKLKLSPDEVAEFDKDTLVKLASYKCLPTIALPKITEKITSRADRDKITDAIKGAHGGDLAVFLNDPLRRELGKPQVKNLSKEAKAIYNFFTGPIGMHF